MGQKVRPTMFLGVPRVWEKIAEKMKAMGASTKVRYFGQRARVTVFVWVHGKSPRSSLCALKNRA